LKEEFILRVLQKASDSLSLESVQAIRRILEEELYFYEMTVATRELVPVQGIPEKIVLYITAKRIDGLAKNTLKSYTEHLLRFARFTQKDILLVDAMDVRRYLAAFSKDGKKNTTIATETSYLKSFYKWLEDEDYIVKSPMRKIKNIKIEKFIRKALTPTELEMLRDACEDTREKAMVEFFYSTGCRLDEAQKLSKSDIDWGTGKIIVLGKGKKERPVFLNAKAKVFLWKYLNTRKDETDALFVSERQPHGRLGRKTFQNTFDELGKRAGITKDVYPHLLRHTTATNMLQNGASLSEVQKLLGHTSPATTQIYASLDNEALQQSHKKHVI
jgi:integrase/recombinase XerD